MSFIAGPKNGTIFEAGFFLVDDEQCLRQTMTISASHLQKVTRNNRVIVPAGAVIPANGATAVGILYEDIDVTDGAAAGSVVTEGTVYEDRLPAALDSDAKTAMTRIRVITSAPAVTRPAEFNANLVALTVASAASATTSGYTALTVSGHTLEAGESYLYKTHATAAPKVRLGEVLPTSGGSAWTEWDGDDEISATTGHKITVAVVDSFGQAVAAGSDDVTAKAAG